LRKISPCVRHLKWLPGYEDELFRRAVEIEIDTGKHVRMCSAEDLIIHKAVAGRPQDIVDIESVVLRQGRRLNVDYIRRWLGEFSDLLATPDILDRFEQAYRKLKTK
jgi:predicted nucleotidyltransferase